MEALQKMTYESSSTYLTCRCTGCKNFRKEKGLPEPSNGRIIIEQNAIIVKHSDGIRKAAMSADGLYKLIISINNNEEE